MLTSEEIERFKTDPEYFGHFRHTLASLMNVGSMRYSWLLIRS